MIEANDDLGITSKRYKLCIVTGMWQRPDVFMMFAEGIKMLQANFSYHVEIVCCVAGSEGHTSETLARAYGFQYVETPNNPLGVKMNKALLLAKSLNPDYCLMVGSDDLIGVSLMSRYCDLMVKKIDFVSLMDCYFFDTKTKLGLYWAGYTKPHNKGKACGVGKLISRSLLDKIEWNCFPPGYDKILDTGFEKQLEKVQFTEVKINLKNENLFALDIKSSTNMTPFYKWDNSELIDGVDMLQKNLPKHLATLIHG